MEPWKKAADPEDAGVSSAGLMQYLDAVEASGLEHHSIMILRHGQLACTLNFAPYDEKTPHVLYSLSKSFCSAAAGFAVQEGLLTWDTTVAEVLPECLPEHPSEELKQITLHHLLCMGSGLHPDSDSFYSGKEWAKFVLSHPVIHAPGTAFHYNSHGTYLVSAMVQKVTGQTIRDYLVPRLFEPLGIPVPEWDLSPDGICTGGWGLHLAAESIARFGQCLLQKGLWQGKQVLPAEWLSRASVRQIDNSFGAYDPDDDWKQGYGYQFWQTVGGRYRGDGMYGQLCVVSEKEDMVVAVTAGIDNIAEELRLIRRYVFPAADMPPASAREQEALQQRIAALHYALPAHDGRITLPTGRFAADQAEVMLTDKEAVCKLRNHEFHFGYGEEADFLGRLRLAGQYPDPGGPYRGRPLHLQGHCRAGWRCPALPDARRPELPADGYPAEKSVN